ncbi:MAG: nitrogenase component 1, partial [Clostridiales bacterium]|nr:nitrogenase component 1 [Clostridiales bacterium]
VQGSGQALEAIARRFLPKPAESSGGSEKRKVNLLGVTPLDFAAPGSVRSLRRVLEENGFEIVSCWAMGDSFPQLMKAAEAEVNLVVSAVGMRLAVYMEETYGIPYVTGIPTGAFTKILCEKMERAADTGISEVTAAARTSLPFSEEKEIALVGEPVAMASLAWAISVGYGYSARVICPLEQCGNLLGEKDFSVKGEREMENALQHFSIIAADPLYKPICPKDAVFYSLPTESFSGRCFWREMPDLVTVFDHEKEV